VCIFRPMTDINSPENSPKPKRPFWKKKRVIIPTILVVLFAAAAGAGGSEEDPADQATTTTVAAPEGQSGDAGTTETTKKAATTTTAKLKPEDDVVISSCGPSDNTYMGPVAKLTITNQSSKPSNYSVTVAFLNADESQQLDTANAYVQTLAPGQVNTSEAQSFKSEIAKTPGLKCKVTNVTRMAS
jgi:hypothetical protein